MTTWVLLIPDFYKVLLTIIWFSLWFNASFLAIGVWSQFWYLRLLFMRSFSSNLIVWKVKNWVFRKTLWHLISRHITIALTNRRQIFIVNIALLKLIELFESKSWWVLIHIINFLAIILFALNIIKKVCIVTRESVILKQTLIFRIKKIVFYVAAISIIIYNEIALFVLIIHILFIMKTLWLLVLIRCIHKIKFFNYNWFNIGFIYS